VIGEETVEEEVEDEEVFCSVKSVQFRDGDFLLRRFSIHKGRTDDEARMKKK
jgi:hypothetical protein